MKFRCYCHYDNYKDIKAEEAKFMLRSYRRLDLIMFIEFYKIPKEDIRFFMEARGMKISHVERNQIYEWELRKKERKLNPKVKTVKSYGEIKIMSYDVSEWPVPLVCALGNVSYDSVKGQRAYDSAEYKLTKDRLQSEINNYFQEKPKEDENSNLTTNDLVAMRYYRGVNRKKMAKLILSTEWKITEIERTFPVPNDIAKTYKEVLKIKNAHIIQLRKVMKGTLDNVIEDRTIPSVVKVAVFGRDKGKCKHCDSKEKLHYHHIERFSDGGQNTVSNLMLLCASCHAEEHKGEKAYHMLKKMSEK